VPLASQHSLFESRQHPLRPDRRFNPGPSSPNLSAGFSPSSGHCVRLRRSVRHVSTFLRSLRSRPITALLRYYGRSDSCPPDPRALPSGLVAGPLLGQVSLIHALGLPTIPSPTTCGRSASSGHVTPRRVEPRLLPHRVNPNGNSGLRHSLAGSPHHTGRIEF